jgi:proteasome accessory factor B
MPMVDRLERLTDLVLVLLGDHRAKSLRQIAAEIPGYPPEGEARRQAFERDKRTLREEGIPLVAEPIDGPDQVGYRIRPEDYYLPDLGLTPEEQAALNLAVAGVHLGDPTGRDALWRLGLDAPAGRRPVADLPALPALPVLFQAVRNHAEASFSYRGDRRRVAPAQLRFRAGRWYLVAHDLDRQAARTFRVDRLDGPVTVGEAGSASLPDDFDADAALPETPWAVGDGAPVAVEVLVDPVAAPRAVHEVGEQSVRQRRPDGSVVLGLAVASEAAFRSWVLEYGERAEVLGPPEVRANLVRWLSAMAEPGPAARAGARGGR